VNRSMAMEYPCKNLVIKYQELCKKLIELGVNPRHAGRDVREGILHGWLSPEVFNIYVEWLRTRRSLLRCVARYYIV